MKAFLLGFAHYESHLVDGVQHAANLTMQWHQKIVLDLLTDGIVPRFFRGHPGRLQLFQRVLQSCSRADEVDSFHSYVLSKIDGSSASLEGKPATSKTTALSSAKAAQFVTKRTRQDWKSAPGLGIKILVVHMKRRSIAFTFPLVSRP